MRKIDYVIKKNEKKLSKKTLPSTLFNPTSKKKELKAKKNQLHLRTIARSRTEDMMFPASTCVETKFYKPTVTPKKMKIDQLFPAQDTNQQQVLTGREGK